MPRQIDRDFSALARAQNEALWERQAIRQVRYNQPALDAILDRAGEQFDAAAHRSLARHLQNRRDLMVERINDAIEVPALFCRSRYFRSLTGGVVLSASDAVSEIRRWIAIERNRGKGAGRIAELREVLVFARYFRRFGQRVWMRQAEAA